ncbi:MAG: sulfotransferase [Elainellaceae cyanobacterium]
MLLNLLLKKKKKLPWLLQSSLAHLAAIGASSELRHAFDCVESFCMFIGYSRSGHSLVAALLDAHPNIAMAHELRAVKYVEANFGRDELYYLLYQNTRIRGHSWKRGKGYTYDVPNQWQGSFDKEIRVIGDKHGEYTVNSLISNPKLVDKLRKTVKVPIRFIHVVRNPFDNIATMALKEARHGSPLDIQGTIDRYFSVCESISTIKSIVGEQHVFDLRHENFVKKTQSQLQALCSWLGVESSTSYLEACSEVVFESPRRSCYEVEWSPAQVQDIKDRIATYPFLDGYQFDYQLAEK